MGAAKDGFEFGFPIPLLEDNVDHINSIEVIWSERFVFSSQSDFAMIESMLAEHPNLRTGPRSEVR